jgi:hypothetical protein
MGVNEAGHQYGVRAADMLARLKLLLDVGAFAYSDNEPAADCHSAIVDQIVMRVHGDDVAGGIDGVGGLGL